MGDYTFEEKLNSIYPKIKSPSFRENKGLGNEVGYYVFDYPAEYELEVRFRIRSIKEKINKGNFDFKLYEYNLYNLFYKFLEEKNYLDKFFKIEEKKGSKKAGDSVNLALGLGNKNWINNYIATNTESNSVVFITGVGQIFPIIRSHNVLNTLHQQLDDVPVVLFLPGEYDDINLRVFGSDAGYYRAFKF